MLASLFPDDALLQRWLELASERVAFQGLPARICWLGYGDRARAGLAINELVRSGEVSAPVVIGRDHLDAGSVASPFRETEAMRDGSDAIADWPILNALVNVAAGATWVSVHHGGGVGIGNSIHAGMVVVADGTSDTAERLERVLTTDPGMGVVRHADAGYEEALAAAREYALDRPVDPCFVSAGRLLIRDLAEVATPSRGAPLRGDALGALDVIDDAYVLCEEGTIAAVGRMTDLRPLAGDVEEVDGRGLSAIPGLVDCHTHACFAGERVKEEFALRSAGASYEELHARGGGILSTVRATRAATPDELAAALERHVGWMLQSGTTTFEAKSGYGLDRDTELAQLRAVRAAGGVATWLGAHTVPPEFAEAGADAYLDFLLAEVLPEAARLAVAADVFLERGAFDADQARRYLTASREEGLALRLHGDQFTESGSDPARDRAGRALRRPPGSDRANGGRRARGERRRRRAAARKRALPRQADAAGARARDAARGRARDGLQPRERLLREPAARLLARRDADGSRDGRSALGLHGERR